LSERLIELFLADIIVAMIEENSYLDFVVKELEFLKDIDE